MNPKTDVLPRKTNSCAGMDIFPQVKAYTLVLDDEGRVLGSDAGASGLPAVRRMIGTDLVEILGSYPCLSRRVPSALCRGLREVLSGEQSFFTLDYPCLSTPGGRTLRVSATRLEGVVPGRVIFTHSDVTEVSRKEDALRLTQFAIDHSADAVFWVENSGRFVYVNEAASRLTGYPKETLLTMSVPDFDPMIAEKGWNAQWEELKRNGTLRVNTQIRHRQGRMIPIELTADHVRFGDRELSCASLRDVSERKKLEEQFYQAQKLEAVARLAGGVAHDFNNLLTVINGYSHMLLEQSVPKDPQREFYQEINDAGRRAAGLTRRLLAFSRKEIIEPVSLDLNTLLREFERMLRRLLGEDIRILMDLAPSLGSVKADPGQMEQIVMNLAVNARDAMPKGGSLVVQTVNVALDPPLARGLGNLPPGPYVRLVVADTGCGMAQAVLDRLFEPFFTTKERGRGTGLGLSTVYGIVQGCGGHIAVESILGKGTAFSIYFPVNKAPAARAAAPEARPARGRETILLLEDERPVRLVARRLLEGHGYRVFEAVSEQEALEIGSDLSRPIDLLLTDVVLPSLSGIEVAKRLQSVRPSLRVLLMSGYTDRSLGDGGSVPSGMGFLQKPFTLESMAKKVRETLDAPAPQETNS
jgi:two-component system cell cycle sensor histidine kinase/response regulator CckA